MKEPYLTYARIAAVCIPPPPSVPGVTQPPSSRQRARSPKSAQIGAHVSSARAASVGEAVVIGAGSRARQRRHRRRGLRGSSARVTVLDGVRIGARCIVHPGRRDRRRRLRLCAGPRRMGQGAAARQRHDRQRRGDRRKHDDRSRHDRRYGHRGRRQARQSRTDRAQRASSASTRSWLRCPASPAARKVGKRCMIGGGVVMINQLDDLRRRAVHVPQRTSRRSITEPGTYSGSLPAEEAAAVACGTLHGSGELGCARRIAYGPSERAADDAAAATRRRRDE